MGRYDGEDYEVVPECDPEKHSFQINGYCFRCRRSREHLINRAERTIRLLKNHCNDVCSVCDREGLEDHQRCADCPRKT